MIAANLITHNATLDDLSIQDYADIWMELRQVGSDKPRSYDKCIELLGTGPSKARWQLYEKGELGLTREMRNALRGYVGLPLLPPTITEAIGAASPDASVWQVGEGIPQHIIMIDDAPVTLHVNGEVKVSAGCSCKAPYVSPVARKHYTRPCIPLEYAARLERLNLSLTWLDIIEAGLEKYEVTIL